MNKEDQKKQIDGLRRIENRGLHKSRSVVLDSIGEKYIPDEPIQRAGRPLQKKEKSLQAPKYKPKNPVSDNKKKRVRELVSKELGEDSDAPKILKKQADRLDEKKPENKKVLRKRGRSTLPHHASRSSKLSKKQKVHSDHTTFLVKFMRSYNSLKAEIFEFRDSFLSELAEFKGSFKKLSQGLPDRLNNISRLIWNMTMFSVLLFFFLYLALSLLVLKLGDEYRFLASLSEKVAVPALVSFDGFIEYDEYRNMRNSLNFEDENLLNQELARLFVFNDLARKHGTADIGVLKKLLPYDEEVNLAPLNRIKKIRREIEENGNFVKTAKKYGDVKQLDTSIEDLYDYDFADAVVKIAEGETSDIIYTENGYYVFHCFEKAEDRMVLSYVYEPTVTYDQYLQERSQSYKYWNLSNI